MTKPSSYKTDVVVIGAGTAGLYLSNILSKKGIKNIVFEKNPSIGKYGNRIINREVFNKLKLTRGDVIRPIKKLKFYSPSEVQLCKKDKNERGYVTNTNLIEKSLYRKLYSEENIKLNSPVIHLDFKKGIVKIREYVIRTEIIIVASGAIHTGFAPIPGTKLRIAFCYTNEIVGCDEITTIIDNNLAHGFYGWVIPLEENAIEVGFGSDMIKSIKNMNLEQRLFSLPHIKNFKKNKKLLRTGGGFIPTSISEKLCGGNWIAIGDASGGEPMMGGSIHKAIDEAEISAGVIEKYMSGEVESLEDYNILWQKNIGIDIKKQEMIRNLLDRCSNDEIDKAFEKLRNKPIEGGGLINQLFMNIVKKMGRVS